LRWGAFAVVELKDSHTDTAPRLVKSSRVVKANMISGLEIRNGRSILKAWGREASTSASLTFGCPKKWERPVKCSSDRMFILETATIASSRLRDKTMSASANDRTRKVVNYTLLRQSHGKLWWRPVALLTCKSFVRAEHRGERLIEPPSSWFPSKFPSG